MWKTEWNIVPYKNRHDVIWYGGTLFTAENDDYVITCEAVGDVYVTFLDGNGAFVEEIKDKYNGGAFYDLMKYYVSDDATLYKYKDNNRLQVDCGNWLEYFMFNKKTKQYIDLWVEEGTDDVVEAYQLFDPEEIFEYARSNGLT